jgi:hypothetical protein
VNNKGQVLVFFVLLIPTLILIAAYVIDVGYSYYRSNELNNLNRMVIKYGLEHIDNSDVRSKMIDLMYKNDNSIDSYELTIENNIVTLKIKKSVESIFGKIANIKFYNLASNYRGYFKDGRIIIEKG